MNVVPMRRPIPNDLAAYWMPFTANRQFKKAPRLLAARRRHALLDTDDGRQILDGIAGLWCVNAGHCRPKIVEAIQAQVAELDFAPAFQMGHPKAFEFADAPGADRARGARPRLLHQLRLRIGRHRAQDRARLPSRARRGLAHPPDRPRARLSRRQLRRHLGRRHRREPQDVRHAARRRRPHPPHARPGAATPSRAASRSTAPSSPTSSSASSTLHDPSTIAAVIVEPVAGSAGVLVPPKGYLEAPARDLRQARHPADLRRGHHRLRPPGHALRGGLLRRRARHLVTAPRASPTASCRWAPCS